jgi:protein O-mannosyl-transferase
LGKKSREKRTAARQPAAEAAAATRVWVYVAGIAILTIVVFGQVVTHHFITYDDGLFVTENAHVRQGLSADSIRWALTSAELGYYPFVWLSHMTDVSLWGMNAGGHLVTALLLHILSSCLLFFALSRMTGAPVRSAFVAALFAIHPMHVESVAWVSERKDTLSTLFGMLALLLYAMPRSVRRDVLLAIAFAASLLSKQMLVTLPFLLLVLDWWPLQRKPAILEKIPLFAIAAGGVFLAIAGQQNLKAVQTTAVLPLGTRIANSLVAYTTYIGKLLWPSRLAPIYPLTAVSSSAAAFSFALLMAITIAAWLLRKRAPYLLTGWLWFIGTLVPVIGIVQIGAASMADRYTYFPAVGLFIAIVWGLADLVPSRVAVAAGVAVAAVLAVLAFIQTSYWKDTETLFTHTLAVTGPNPIAEYTLGQVYETDDPDRAIPHLRRAIDLTEAALQASPNSPKPDLYAQAHVGIGTALLEKAKSAGDAAEKARLVDQAGAEYQAALRIDPNAGNAQRNLALVQSMRATASAGSVDRLIDAGVALSQKRQFDAAIAEYRKAVALAPDSVEPHVYLGIGLAQAGRNAEAASELRAAQKIDAARANRYVTGILRLQQNPENLEALLRQLK